MADLVLVQDSLLAQRGDDVCRRRRPHGQDAVGLRVGREISEDARAGVRRVERDLEIDLARPVRARRGPRIIDDGER